MSARSTGRYNDPGRLRCKLGCERQELILVAFYPAVFNRYVPILNVSALPQPVAKAGDAVRIRCHRSEVADNGERLLSVRPHGPRHRPAE
jgi:hypothetical protein